MQFFAAIFALFFAICSPALAAAKPYSIIDFLARQELVNIPKAQEFYPNLSTHSCADECLRDLLARGYFLSFLSAFKGSDDERLHNNYSKLLNGIERVDLGPKISAKSVQIAVVLPEKLLRSYTPSIASPVLAYLIAQKIDSKMQVFYTGFEQLSAEQIEQLQGFDIVITGFRGAGLKNLAAQIKAPIFAPLSPSSQWPDAPDHVYFGGINYEAQIAALLGIAGENVAEFMDDSELAARLDSALQSASEVAYKRVLPNKSYQINHLLTDVEQLDGASVFFNVSLIKATLIATQLRGADVHPAAFLSTQINFHPMFLNLAQEAEKELFYFASVIGKTPATLQYLNDLLGQKIAYNWIAYSTSCGIDGLFGQRFSDAARLFEEHFLGQQLDFKTRIFSSAGSKFSEVTSARERRTAPERDGGLGGFGERGGLGGLGERGGFGERGKINEK